MTKKEMMVENYDTNHVMIKNCRQMYLNFKIEYVLLRQKCGLCPDCLIF